MHHSDRGIQYASGEYVAILRKHEIVPSVGSPQRVHPTHLCHKRAIRSGPLCAKTSFFATYLKRFRAGVVLGKVNTGQEYSQINH